MTSRAPEGVAQCQGCDLVQGPGKKLPFVQAAPKESGSGREGVSKAESQAPPRSPVRAAQRPRGSHTIHPQRLWSSAAFGLRLRCREDQSPKV